MYNSKNKLYDEDELIPIKQYFINQSDTFLLDLLKKDGWYNKTETKYITHSRSHNLFEKKKKCMSVFERLTDQKFYSGIHKNKFENLVNDKKSKLKCNSHCNNDHTKKDNNSSYSNSNYNYNNSNYNNGRLNPPSPTTIMKKPAHIMGLQKYGLQIAHPKVIWLYRNGDKYHNGKYFLIKPYIKNIETLLIEISQILFPIIGPIRKIYDQNFEVMHKLEDLIDGGKYLCTNGRPPAPLHMLKRFLSKWVVHD
ncbi:apicortin, putative [Hepatocystis sp. ex Piliocolobus tephrosceles]|nr:apicortin, putative [Hepatocystis sp. ex Piliocolobus tephrosceles]